MESPNLWKKIALGPKSRTRVKIFLSSRYIPILANNAQPCVHQLRAELVPEKRAKEIFFLAVALPFAHAFCATAVPALP
jgi:hypothetical protein